MSVNTIVAGAGIWGCTVARRLAESGKKVLANYEGRIYYLPLGLALINKYFGVELKPGEVVDFMADEAHSKAIFDAFFRGYKYYDMDKSIESALKLRV